MRKIIIRKIYFMENEDNLLFMKRGRDANKVIQELGSRLYWKSVVKEFNIVWIKLSKNYKIYYELVVN
jgi:hypothetical protein